MTVAFRFLPLMLAVWALCPDASAHRLDEYLQATLVVIEPGGMRLHINLTPGVAVAKQVLDRMDLDRGGVISKQKAVAYAESLRRDLRVRLDEREMELKFVASGSPLPPKFGPAWGSFIWSSPSSPNLSPRASTRSP